LIEIVIAARKKDLGGGLEVGRVLPFAKRRMVGPFTFLDHMGPADFAPGQGVDVRPHPHIGLATVTYLFEGEILHHDNLGTVQPIVPGEVNWMTAGRGIVHSERTKADWRARGGVMDGIQAWVALPLEKEEVEPSFAHFDADALPRFDEGGASGTLIAGTFFGLSALETLSPLFFVHLEMQPDSRFTLPDDHAERAAYVAKGRILVDGHPFDPGQMVVFAPGEARIETTAAPARVMLLGGAPVGARHLWWNFVSSSLDRIEEAKREWRAGRMALPPSDAGEFIPLPEEPPKPAPTDPV
jgi:redox-sensitive bicupin YhaK (pirin superfamily)